MKLSLTKTLHFDYPWRLSIVKQSLKKKRGCYKIISWLPQQPRVVLFWNKKQRGSYQVGKKKRVFSWFSLLTKSLEFSFSAEQNWKKKELWFSLFCQLLSKERPKVLNLSTFILCWKQKLKKKKKGFALLSKEWSKVLSFHSLSKTKTREKKVLVLSCVQRTSKTAFDICWKQKPRNKRFCRILSPFKKMTMLKTKAGEKKKALIFFLLSKERSNFPTFILCWKQKPKRKKRFWCSLFSVKRMTKSSEFSFSVENKN